MKKKRFTEEQIVRILRAAETTTIEAVARQHGVSEQSIYRWKRPNYLFLLSWFTLMAAPAFLADSAAMSKRALGALPAATVA